jgi:hypothetical protein
MSLKPDPYCRQATRQETPVRWLRTQIFGQPVLPEDKVRDTRGKIVYKLVHGRPYKYLPYP